MSDGRKTSDRWQNYALIPAIMPVKPLLNLGTPASPGYPRKPETHEKIVQRRDLLAGQFGVNRHNLDGIAYCELTQNIHQQAQALMWALRLDVPGFAHQKSRYAAFQTASTKKLPIRADPAWLL